MTDAPFATKLLAGDHDRASFACGIEPLDRYFRQQASQDQRRRISSCFVLTETATNLIAGYFTLASAHVLMSDLPDVVSARLPHYRSVPAALIGRLAVATAFQGRKLGASLLADATSRAARADLAVFAMVVDPKDGNARQFYEHHGFQDLRVAGERMFIPMQSALRFLAPGTN